MRSRIPILFLLQFPIVFLGAQQYWALTGSIHSVLYSIDLDCGVESELDWLVTEDFLQYGSSMTPNGNFYALADNNDIFQVNTTNGNPTLILDFPNNGLSLQGLACISNSICYSIDRTGGADTLVEINLFTGTVTPVLPLEGHVHLSDLGLFNGDLYYENDGFTDGKLTRITLSNPMVQEVVMDLPDDIYFFPMTATSQCHTLLSKTGVGDQHVLINTLDGDMNYISGNPYWNFGITGMVEFETPACVTSVDLDCDDSSGADGYDYKSPDYYCITTNGVPICDQDIIFLYDTLIDFVTIELSGSIPDGNLEYLEMNASYPGLTITGSGTQSILIKNNGTAPSTVFKNAMRNIRYFNDALFKTLGTRLVRVNGKTYYNSEMPEAIAYVEIAYYPVYEPDLGPDTVLCDGNFLVLNSNVTNVAYDWSTGETTQMISVTESGEYAVSVSGDEFCPNVDSVEVTFIPSVTVGLANTPIGCAGETFGIIVEVDSDIPVDIVVFSIPGDTIFLNDVSSDTEVPIVINASTYFEILSVTSSQPMCLTIDNSYLDFDVLPTYYDTIAVGICEGDSFLIAPGEYVDQPGYYTVLDNTQFGCDSITTYTIHFSQSIDVYIESTTCMAADTGTFVHFIDNPSGCDTILQTHIVLGPPDTAFVNAIACRTGQEGIFTETLLSVDGCDSIVVRNIILMPPQDTSWSYQTSCDQNAWGTFFLIYPNQEGCDSLTILTINPGVADTTRIAATSCNPAETGVFETLLQGQDLCDSLVITTITLGSPDTTLIFKTSCDSASLGLSEIHYNSLNACDSVVITSTTYSEQDSTFLTSSSCNPDEVGDFVEILQNQLGCDSIVTTTVSLLPSDETFITGTTCDPLEAGDFVEILQNQFGCDSIVHETVSLLSSSATFLSSSTCNSSQAGTFITTLQNQYGCDSIVTLTVSLIPADTTQLISGTCDPAQVGSTQNTFTNQDGCDSLVIQTTELFPLPLIECTSHFGFQWLRYQLLRRKRRQCHRECNRHQSISIFMVNRKSGSKHHRIKQWRLLRHYHRCKWMSNRKLSVDHRAVRIFHWL